MSIQSKDGWKLGKGKFQGSRPGNREKLIRLRVSVAERDFLREVCEERNVTYAVLWREAFTAEKLLPAHKVVYHSESRSRRLSHTGKFHGEKAGDRAITMRLRVSELERDHLYRICELRGITFSHLWRDVMKAKGLLPQD